MLQSPIAKSIGIALKNQIGAAAFGSLLLAVVWFIQWVMRYVTKKLKDVKDPTGVKRFLICCCNVSLASCLPTCPCAGALTRAPCRTPLVPHPAHLPPPAVHVLL